MHYFSGWARGVFPHFILQAAISFGQNNLMNRNPYPLIAVAISQSICRLRLVRSEDEHTRFIREFIHLAVLLYAILTLEALYRQKREFILTGL